MTNINYLQLISSWLGAFLVGFLIPLIPMISGNRLMQHIRLTEKQQIRKLIFAILFATIGAILVGFILSKVPNGKQLFKIALLLPWISLTIVLIIFIITKITNRNTAILISQNHTTTQLVKIIGDFLRKNNINYSAPNYDTILTDKLFSIKIEPAINMERDTLLVKVKFKQKIDNILMQNLKKLI